MTPAFNKKIQASIMIMTLSMTMLVPLVTLNAANHLPVLHQNNPGWWNPGWPYRKLITINHTKVSANLLNFPVLISLSSDPGLAAAAQPAGQDLVFVRYPDNTTVLAHEIEFFNHTTGQLVAWVNVTTVSATNDTRIWLYYGNTTCSDQQDIEGTWEPHYVYVHHLNETSGPVYDSTQYHNDGTSHGAQNRSAPGKMDGGFYFDRIDDYVDTANSSSVYNAMKNAFTVEAWSKLNTFNTFRSTVTKDKGGTGKTSEFWFGWANNNKLDFKFNAATDRFGNTTITDTNWHYMVGTFNGSSMRLFLDGHPDNSPVTVAKVVPSNGSVNLGVTKYWGNNYYKGTLDEIRISNVARNSSWIQTSYQNQHTPWAFSTIGQQEHYLYTLTISVIGQGSVIKDPNQPSYPYGTTVNLTAVPNTSWVFDHWSGDLNGTQNPASLLINENKSVTAWFVAQNNTPPVAENDTATVVVNSTNNPIDVLANDYDPDGDNLTIISVTPPLFGNATHDGVFVYYTPNTSYVGPDSFSYTISDGQGGTASATVGITVLPNGTNTPPYPPSQPIPDNGEINVSITTNLWWTGGDPDPGDTVLYDVYFGTTHTPPLVSQHQSNLTYDLGLLAYNTTYYWRIIAWDTHNASTEGPLWMFTTRQEAGAVQVTLTRPMADSFYFRNIRLCSLPGTTILYGPLTITAEATADTTVERVEFYINGKLKHTDNTPPYTYRWAPLRCFKHVLSVIAYDSEENTASDELTVFKWRLHPFVLLAGWILFTNPS